MIIVTGGSHGIGAAVVEQLAARGQAVLFTGRDVQAGTALAARAQGSTFFCADAADPVAVQQAVARAAELGGGSIEGLVNNAGTSSRVGFLDTSLDEWDRVMAVNARATFQFTQLALPALMQARGAVVNVASIAGKVGEEGLATYCASKGAVIALTQALALEYGDRVRFNAVCPGQIATRMMARVMADASGLQALTQRIPAGRLGDAGEVAQAVCWLLSPEASFINGTVLTIDGGETAGLRTPRTASSNPSNAT